MPRRHTSAGYTARRKGGPCAPRPRRLARVPRCGQGRGAQPRGSRTPASIGRVHASHQPPGFATCDCARLPSTRRSSMGGRGGGGRARTPTRVTRRLRRGSTPCRTDAARLVVAGEVLHVRRLLPVGRMTGAVVELVLLAVAVAAEVLGAVAACSVLAGASSSWLGSAGSAPGPWCAGGGALQLVLFSARSELLRSGGAAPQQRGMAFAPWRRAS